MNTNSAMPEQKAPLTPEQFARLGDGAVAYIKRIRSEDVSRFYPQAPEIAPGQIIFALVGADGAPILLSDSVEAALGSARENELHMLSLH